MGNASLEVINGAHLAEARISRHLTRIDLAKVANVSRPTIYLLETGGRIKVSQAVADRLSKALKARRSDLFRVVA